MIAGSDSLALITVQEHLALPGVSSDIANCSIEKLRVRFCGSLSDAWSSALLPEKHCRGFLDSNGGIESFVLPNLTLFRSVATSQLTKELLWLCVKATVLREKRESNGK